MSKQPWAAKAAFDETTQEWDVNLGGVRVPPHRLVSVGVDTRVAQTPEGQALRVTVLRTEIVLSGVEPGQPPPSDEPPAPSSETPPTPPAPSAPEAPKLSRAERRALARQKP